VSDAKSFDDELQGLINLHMTNGVVPRDIVDVMSRQISLVIDRNNLELEMELRPAKG
jgi:hypothetical protein